MSNTKLYQSNAVGRLWAKSPMKMFVPQQKLQLLHFLKKISTKGNNINTRLVWTPLDMTLSNMISGLKHKMVLWFADERGCLWIISSLTVQHKTPCPKGILLRKLYFNALLCTLVPYLQSKCMKYVPQKQSFTYQINFELWCLKY